MRVDLDLAHALLEEQFPHWAQLRLRAVDPQGWDNRTFRLGDALLLRFPVAEAYASHAEKEQRWLPRLAPHLTVQIPSPAGAGRPALGYPWNWSIYRWIDGEVPRRPTKRLAQELGEFLAGLQRIDATDGPLPGVHNFHRGGDLLAYEEEVERALVILEGRVDPRAVERVWSSARATHWNRPPVWVHGDVSPGNLLTRTEALVAVIDFGNLAAGDPACDLAIGWSWFDQEERGSLRSALQLDDATWLRGRAWALWKALVVAAGLSPTNATDYADPMKVVQRCLAE